jgi:hypothetical protein
VVAVVAVVPVPVLVLVLVAADFQDRAAQSQAGLSHHTSGRNVLLWAA